MKCRFKVGKNMFSITFIILAISFLFCSFIFAGQYKYVYTGKNPYTGQTAVLKFNIHSPNVVKGVLEVQPVCKRGSVYLAGGKVYFTAYIKRRGTYPVIRGSYESHNIAACPPHKRIGKSRGSIVIKYHPYWKLYLRLYRKGGHGGVEYRFKNANNPFK
ncbi:MAG: hypothetical protein OD816_001461 [Thermodesulfobacterium sp.]|uniref:Uncharacterized protein n=1 Tax=Candidatus Thermodesulfobacterium syntrophicum TaxID=3060442 RepID=A0AAE3P6H5_9BACT|nr:hypothetical protein [Candidatus Thermodesulfobacterium syntrophicum]